MLPVHRLQHELDEAFPASAGDDQGRARAPEHVRDEQVISHPLHHGPHPLQAHPQPLRQGLERHRKLPRRLQERRHGLRVGTTVQPLEDMDAGALAAPPALRERVHHDAAAEGPSRRLVPQHEAIATQRHDGGTQHELRPGRVPRQQRRRAIEQHQRVRAPPPFPGGRGRDRGSRARVVRRAAARRGRRAARSRARCAGRTRRRRARPARARRRRDSGRRAGHGRRAQRPPRAPRGHVRVPSRRLAARGASHPPRRLPPAPSR